MSHPCTHVPSLLDDAENAISGPPECRVGIVVPSIADHMMHINQHPPAVLTRLTVAMELKQIGTEVVSSGLTTTDPVTGARFDWAIFPLANLSVTGTDGISNVSPQVCHPYHTHLTS